MFDNKWITSQVCFVLSCFFGMGKDGMCLFIKVWNTPEWLDWSSYEDVVMENIVCTVVQNQYIMRQRSNENKEKYQSGDY